MRNLFTARLRHDLFFALVSEMGPMKPHHIARLPARLDRLVDMAERVDSTLLAIEALKSDHGAKFATSRGGIRRAFEKYGPDVTVSKVIEEKRAGRFVCRP